MTVEIQLTQGKVALIDDEDLPLVSGHKWRAQKAAKPNTVRWYAVTTTRQPDGRLAALVMHRLILGARHGELVDHRDGDGLNNRRTNIRTCNTHLNNVNRASYGKRSKYKGITPTRYNTWEARIGNRPKKKYLGSFKTEEDAARAYDAAAKSMYGDFARLNFPG